MGSPVIMIILNSKKDVVFSYTCKKQSQHMDANTLSTSVAECLAKHWKEHLH